MKVVIVLPLYITSYRKDDKGSIMKRSVFVAIDFDGTIINQDITDAVIQKFAKPGWEIPERLWEAGQMGSRECLAIQMSLVTESKSAVLNFIDRFKIDPHFLDFAIELGEIGVSYSVVSDGFKIFIERLLRNAGFTRMPLIHANELIWTHHKLQVRFPYSSRQCASGTCKCSVVDNLSGGNPVILIGDGRSDFCLAQKADYIFAKGKLSRFCSESGLPFRAFHDFSEISKCIKETLAAIPAAINISPGKYSEKGQNNTWNIAR